MSGIAQRQGTGKVIHTKASDNSSPFHDLQRSICILHTLFLSSLWHRVRPEFLHQGVSGAPPSLHPDVLA